MLITLAQAVVAVMGVQLAAGEAPQGRSYLEEARIQIKWRKRDGQVLELATLDVYAREVSEVSKDPEPLAVA